MMQPLCGRAWRMSFLPVFSSDNPFWNPADIKSHLFRQYAVASVEYEDETVKRH